MNIIILCLLAVAVLILGFNAFSAVQRWVLAVATGLAGAAVVLAVVRLLT